MTHNLPNAADVRNFDEMIHSEQLKAARHLAGLTIERLAEASGVSVITLRRLEAQDGPIGARDSTLEKVEKGLLKAGVALIAEDAFGGVGARKLPPHLMPKKKR